MYTTDLRVNYKNRCTRCNSWVNETDRYCPMCGFKAVDVFDPRYDDFSDDQFTQCLNPNIEARKVNGLKSKIVLSFFIPDINYEFSIDDGQSKWYIGSSSNCSIVVKRNYISRYHALISYDYDAGKLYISDNNSTNGTYVNCNKLTPGQPVEIKSNDVIGLSESFQIVFKGKKVNT